MPALNFQKRFAEAVEFGDKTQTIRAHRKDGRAHAKRGDVLKLYTGMRSKGCRLLGEGRVIWTEDVEIREDWSLYVGRHYVQAGDALRGETEDRDNDFAEKDGFKGAVEMYEWFQETHGLPFEGTLIRWELLA